MTDRQTIIETNRSLRNIKNARKHSPSELENLLEKGVIDDSVFDTITAALPAESSLSGPLRTATSNTATSNTATPARETTSPAPTQAFESLNINKTQSPAPPSYEQTPAPGVPARNVRPAIAHARALYRYMGGDARDLSLEKDDRIAVYEYMNADWWMGRNERTGLEGIFPRTYVFLEQENKGPMPPQQPMYGYPPQQQNPYNANVPPMAVAEGGQAQQGEGNGKVGEYGKKFGKKLGNAAIFGAGATIGGNIVNSIF